MTNRRSPWWDHDAYPKGKSFAEMFDWHLSHWGTKPECSLEHPNPCESVVVLAMEFHKGVPEVKTDTNSETKLLNWRKGKHPPSDETVIGNIFRYLFGDDERLNDWKYDLQEALEKTQNKVAETVNRSKETDNLHSALDTKDPILQDGINHSDGGVQHSVSSIAIATAPTIPNELSRTDRHSKTPAKRRNAFTIIGGLIATLSVFVAWKIMPQIVFDKGEAQIAKVIDDSKSNIARKEIDGLWGEGSAFCSGNTFLFEIMENTLLLSGVRQPPKTKKFVLDGQIQPNDSQKPNSLTIIVTKTDGSNGKRDVGAATFTYIKNGLSEEMIWDDAEDSDPRRLFKCVEG